MTARDTTSGERAKNRATINSLLKNRHARKDMLNGLFQEHFTAPATIRCTLDDHVVHLNPHDSTITPAVLEKGHWNRHELERALAVLRDNGTLRDNGVFLDVGANIGTQTIYAMRAQVDGMAIFREGHAFEPEPENARLLGMNVDENALTDVVVTVPHAVGAVEGAVTLYRHARNTGAHSVLADGARDEATSVEVRMTTLDAHLARAELSADQVGLVWIDVEGAEPGVVAGATLLTAARVPLVFEFLDRDRARPEFADMFATLRARYSHVSCLQDGTRSVAEISNLTPDVPEGDYMVFSKGETDHA